MKRYSRVTCIVLTIIILLGITLCNNTQTNAEEITVYPENMLCVRIVDESGNIVPGVSATLVDPSGTEIAKWDSEDLDATKLNNSKITVRDHFNEPWSTFEKLVAPGILKDIYKYTSIVGHYSGFSKYITAWENRTIEELVFVYEPASLECDLTVPANTYMVYADSKWASAYGKPYVSVNGTETSIVGIAGKLTSFTATPKQKIKAGCKVEGGSIPDYVTTLSTYTSSSATEYDKVRTKLDIGSSAYLNRYGQMIGNSEMDTSGKYVDIASGDYSGGEGLLICVSGSVITYPVPDENGYMDIYVDRSTGQYRLYMASYWQGGRITPREDVEDIVMVSFYDIKTCEYPDNCTFMGNLTAGNYTIELQNIPEQYIPQSTVSVTVKDSTEFQMLDIVLKKPHVHSYGNDYKSDASNHWMECSCGDKSGVAAHTPGPEATIDSPQVCTVCGYVIKPALGHTHSFEGDYKSDASNHWKVCSCGAKGQMSAHTPGPEATEDTDQICTVCGCILKPALNHTHKFSDEYVADEDNHWKECLCGEKDSEGIHIFDWIVEKEATKDKPGLKHEECTVCHYQKSSVEILIEEEFEKETEEQTTDSETTSSKKQEQTDATTVEETEKETEENTKNTGKKSGFRWMWLLLLFIIIIIIIFIIIIILKKKDEKEEDEEVGEEGKKE